VPDVAPRTWPRSVSIAIAISIGVLAVGLAAYAASGLSTRYWADDFCTGSAARDRGLGAAVGEWYVGWTGSYSKELFVGLVVLLGPLAMPLWATMLGGSWLLALGWAGLQVTRLLGGRAFVAGAVVLAEVVLLGYLRMLPNRMESFYWIMGSVSYTLPLVFFTFLAGIVLERLARREPPGVARLAICFALAFVAAGLTETFMAWQVGALVLALLGSRLPAARARWPFLTRLVLVALAGAAIGGLIVAVAPGNLVRTSTLSDPPLPLVEVVWRSVADGLRFGLRGLANPSALVAAATAALVTVLVYAGPRPSLRIAILASVVVAAVAAALVVATYIPPYQAIHRAPPARSLTTAVVSVLAAAVALGSIAGAWAQPLLVSALAGRTAPAAGRSLGLASALPVAAVAIAAAATVIAATSLRAELRRQPELARFATAWEARSEALTRAAAANAPTVTVPSIPMFTIALAEPTDDPEFWVNGCIARFYGLETVIAR
jgi:hypothetical protein